MELSKEERRRLKAERRLEKQGIVPANTFEDDKVTVLCVRFGNKYGREYVERLRNMVKRHLTIPYEFVCLTDDQHGIDGVRTIYQAPGPYKKLWWHKVHMFDPRLPVHGRILYFDLDVIIHNNIDKLATNLGNAFYGIQDFNRKFYSNWKIINSSVLSWRHGSHSEIYDKFMQNPAEAQRLQGDQDWIYKISFNKIKYWPTDWILSYKWEIRKREELVYERGQRLFKDVQNNLNINPECCVAVFHGDPKPQDVKDKFVVDNWR